MKFINKILSICTSVNLGGTKPDKTSFAKLCFERRDVFPVLDLKVFFNLSKSSSDTGTKTYKHLQIVVDDVLNGFSKVILKLDSDIYGHIMSIYSREEREKNVNKQGTQATGVCK